MSGYASSLENLGEADNVRQQRKNLQSSRLVGTTTNRELAKINAGRKFVGGARARVEKRMIGSGGGLPSQEAFENMRVMGKTLSGGRMSYSGGRKHMTKAEMKKMKNKAEKLGKLYGSELKKQDPEVQELVGSGFLEDFGRGFLMPFKALSSVAKPILSTVGGPVGKIASAGLSAIGLGAGEEEMEMSEEEMEMPKNKRTRKKRGGAMTGGGVTGGGMTGGKKRRRKAGANDKRKKRGAMISRLMKQEGMSLGQASKYIKENGLMD